MGRDSYWAKAEQISTPYSDLRGLTTVQRQNASSRDGEQSVLPTGRIEINQHTLDITSDDEIVCADCGESFEIPELIQHTAPHRTVAYRLYLIGKFSEIDCDRRMLGFDDEGDHDTTSPTPLPPQKTYTSNDERIGTRTSNKETTSTEFSMGLDIQSVSDEEIEKLKQVSGVNDSQEAPIRKFIQSSNKSSYL